MSNLFNEMAGFRLARFEIFNWGTFNSEIYVMSPDSDTAVLTGANGSGKSTIVDALLSLLVESRKRNYNLASGAGSSRERNERTYILGQYSRSRGDSAIEAKANTLRDSSSYSVLLGVFRDESKNRIVTLVQILWISNAGRVEHRYYVADCDLSIEEHFSQRHIKNNDLPNGVEAYGNSFKNYIAAARKVLGLAGKHKALDLFNETVAVKDIPSLNRFVRDHMLDRGNPERKVDALRDQYRELSDAHAAIQRADQQLKILKPLVDAASEYRDYENRIVRYEEAKILIPFYIAEKAQTLIQTAIQKSESQRQAQQGRLNTIENTLKTLRSDLDRVNISIAHDNVGQAKRNIEGRIPLIEENVRARQLSAKRYDDFANRLEMQTYRDEEAFYGNIASAQMMLQGVEDEIETLESEQRHSDYELRDIQEQAQDRETEIQYLRDNLSNIPAQVARIREKICRELNLELDELPFVGELLRVRGGEEAWEGAIERLLHSFAQDLIVPEDMYKQVSHFVNDNNLRGRLVYHRVDPRRKLKRLPEKREQLVEGQMIYEKLDIKDGTSFNDWLLAKLMTRFDYVCCHTLDDFHKAKRAITQHGQIKHDTTRHEKDDRRKIDDRGYYVLGWDNRDKLKQLESEFASLQRNMRDLDSKILDINTTLKQRLNDIQNLQSLLRFEDFTEIDWRNRQIELDRLQHELEQLNQQSQQLQHLEAQHDDLQRQINETDAERTKIIGRMSTFDNTLESLRQKLDHTEKTLSGWNNQHQALYEQVGDVLVDIDRETLTIENLERRPNELAVSMQGSITSFKGYQTQHRSVILDAMHLFRREYADEGVALTADIESLSAFEAIYSRLETDDLPQYEERFKQMLDRHVASSIQDFMAQLDKQERDIDRSIEELNESLSQIDYGGNSTIRLIAEPARDAEIADFRNQLRACIPNYGDDSREELDRAFRRIQELIERFNDDPNWMRRVIDVRRWRIFAAEQIDTDGNQLDYYNDSSGKSGGQKAKLAYTILASAIAYQYGLQDELVRERSFRFVVVDEAFSKLDDNNARFAMQLFKQLGLQLLVVTPMQQLHIIEDYVKAYHIVVNNDEGSYSQLFNLTQNEYRERRRELQGREQLA